MNLCSCPLATDLRIEAVCFEPQMCLRLREMGIYPGSVVRVTQRAGFNGRVLAAGEQRFALDAATAARVEVAATV